MKRMRTCIACRREGEKDDFFRIARMSDGSVILDAKGNGAGRGAYVCSSECFESARAKNRFPRVLRGSCPESALDEISASIVLYERS